MVIICSPAPMNEKPSNMDNIPPKLAMKGKLSQMYTSFLTDLNGMLTRTPLEELVVVNWY